MLKIWGNFAKASLPATFFDKSYDHWHFLAILLFFLLRHVHIFRQYHCTFNRLQCSITILCVYCRKPNNIYDSLYCHSLDWTCNICKSVCNDLGIRLSGWDCYSYLVSSICIVSSQQPWYEAAWSPHLIQPPKHGLARLQNQELSEICFLLNDPGSCVLLLARGRCGRGGRRLQTHILPCTGS